MSLTREELLSVLRDANRSGYLGGSVGGGNSAAPSSAGGGTGISDKIRDAALGSSDALNKFKEVAGTTGEVLFNSLKKVADQNFTIADAAGGVGEIFKEMGGPGKVLGEVISSLGSYGQETVEKWREVSKFGAGFANDAIGFRAGAAQTRMSFEEYTSFLAKNKDSIVGLGANVTESAKAFNKLSKDFFDSGLGEELRHMGMNTADVNEALALQAGFQKSTMNTLGQERARQAAFELAEEMDALAKLTGKSRQEQTENLKKAQADMQVEAKMRLIGAKDGPEAEAKARAMYAKQYADAEARGQGQMFKEVFATGQVQSKEASTQLAIQGQAAMETVKQARATAARDEEGAKKANESATAEMYKLQKSTAYLSLAVNTSGDVAKAAQAGMTANSGRFQTLQALELEYKEKGIKMSEAQLVAEQERRAKLDQQGKKVEKDKDGKNVDVAQAGAETTKAMIDLESRAKDAGAAINEHMVAPINDALGKSIYEFRNKIDDKGKKNDLLSNFNAEGVTARQSYGAPMAMVKDTILGTGGAAQPTKVTDPKTGKEHNVPTVVAAERDKKEKLGLVDTLGKLGIMNVTDLTVTGKFNPGVARSKGSLGETGNLFENFGAGTLAMLHGKESVVTEDQMKALMKGAQSSNIEGMLKNLTSSVGSPKGESGIDIAKLSKDFSTSISSPKSSAPSMGGIKTKDQEIEEKFRQLEQQQGPKAAAEARKSSADTSDTKMGKDTSLSDLDDKLDQLNKTMMQLVAISAETAENSGKQIKATKGLGGNLFA